MLSTIATAAQAVSHLAVRVADGAEMCLIYDAPATRVLCEALSRVQAEDLTAAADAMLAADLYASLIKLSTRVDYTMMDFTWVAKGAIVPGKETGSCRHLDTQLWGFGPAMDGFACLCQASTIKEAALLLLRMAMRVACECGRCDTQIVHAGVLRQLMDVEVLFKAAYTLHKMLLIREPPLHKRLELANMRVVNSLLHVRLWAWHHCMYASQRHLTPMQALAFDHTYHLCFVQGKCCRSSADCDCQHIMGVVGARLLRTAHSVRPAEQRAAHTRFLPGIRHPICR